MTSVGRQIVERFRRFAEALEETGSIPIWGRFVGNIEAEWLSDGRKMRILRRVLYLDAHGGRWTAEAGEVVNGASVPWFFRRLFPAYIGFYRRASVFHDTACWRRESPSWMVHRMFYEAMLCDGVGPVQAWLMWAAVRVFGPRFAGADDDEAFAKEFREMCKEEMTITKDEARPNNDSSQITSHD